MNKYLFEEARKLYREAGGTVRGFGPEWINFVKESKSKDWRECGWTIDSVAPLLKPAIQAQIAHRAALKSKNEFGPPWKHFKTWINGQWWTEEIPQTNKPKVLRCVICSKTDVTSSTDGKGWRCWRQDCIEKFARMR